MGAPIFPAAETQNFGVVLNIFHTLHLSYQQILTALPSISIYIQNLPLFTMSFVITLVQATIVTCLRSCSSLLMLPPSVITVAGVVP